MNGDLPDRSKLRRSPGLLLLTIFSWPLKSVLEGRGVVLPVSKVLLRIRFAGLFGEVLREAGRGAAVFDLVDDRRASFALGGYGTARGDETCDGLPMEKADGVETARFGGDGERGDFGDGLGDFVIRRNFDGDLDRERLRDRTAEVTST